jgi:chromosome segregation protein
MRAPARLTALRLVGFKSFAERTTVEFGPGISAIVGPNGSGKSNLADALRWTLGEAGRGLRTRRAEDVIFAGSSARRAISMADVTLVIDNGDRLLPVDYGEVELGRRLYRSGENEYLLNRQRVRLRDLIELLDAGNLADNAFLFIGQGMVDQALALRPEERRPLFEEAAGVRRHERRRRHAESELAEAEGNLERLRDLLAELRPQARRLAAQAEQLQARQTAGLELAEALVASARGRWTQSAEAAARAQAELDATHAEADAAMAELRAAEEEAERLSSGLGERADQERRQRDALEELRSRLLELRLRRERSRSELEGVTRDQGRIASERATIERRSADARLVLARAQPASGDSVASELNEVERELERLTRLAEADAQFAASAGEAAARAAQEAAARTAELERRRRRHAEADQRLSEARSASTDLERAMVAAVAERDEAVSRLSAAAEAEARTEREAEDARRDFDAASARHADRARALADGEARTASMRARLEELEAAIAASVDTALLRGARARGGSLAAEGLEIEQRFRPAVAAALGEAARAVAVGESAVLPLSEAAGILLISDPAAATGRGRSRSQQADRARVSGAASAHDGGLLADAIRRDPQGHVARLLERCAWAPDLARALAMRDELPAGWSVATLAGELVTDAGLVRLAATSRFLDERARRDDLARELRRLEASAADAASVADSAAGQRQAAAAAWESARRNLDEQRRAHRVAQEAERTAQRRAEATLREHAWHQSLLERLERESEEAATQLAEARADAKQEPVSRGVGAGAAPAGPDAQVAERLAGLRARRERLAAAHSQELARQRAHEDERRRAQLTLALDETRTVELDAEAQRLAARQAELRADDERVAADLASAGDAEERVRAELDRLLAGGADERALLKDAERAALTARERLRATEGRSRTAEVHAMEARLQLEQVREQLLVELAGIGSDGLVALHAQAGMAPAEVDDLSPDVLGSRLDEALEAALEAWQAAPAPAEVPPPGRLTTLRRRFHELGASNPFAVQEYAEVRQRLESLESQRDDLEAAISATRELIAGLSSLITEQFRTTFAALEDAFARRFRQLFDGGEAQLSLTAPEDLSATGVEITARPPGKKRQPLAMLSGGERSLTAVALLLAMLEVRPVPFCVLDEVDAALDEANIARFSSALRGLADRIQFIVITHNRGTIEAADALYGVTIGEDAVSRVVSLRLPAENGDTSGSAVEELASVATTGD